MADTASAIQQFQQQIDFFRAKLNLPTERWDDIKQSAHDRAFIVAGAQKASLLADLRQAVDKAVIGGSIQQFRNDFAEAVKTSGWSGWTGQGSESGEAWRTRVIYQTNMATSYAAGRYRQLTDPELLKARPYWRYVHSDGVMHPRPEHLAWNGLTLPNDHPFWETNFPPNGWGCQCSVVAVRLPREGDATEPPKGWDAMDPKTGAPAGVDKGWNYAPGANADTPLRQMVQDKLIDYPPAIGKALTRDVNRTISADERVPDFARAVLADRQRTDPLWLGFVEDPEAIGETLRGADVRGYMALMPAESVRHVEISHEYDGGSQRPPTPEDFARALAVLNTPDPGGLRLGSDRGKNGELRVIASKTIDGEGFRTVWEARPGKRNRAMALVSLAVKIAKRK